MRRETVALDVLQLFHASTGPHSEECGEWLRCILLRLLVSASTGPHSEECGEDQLVANYEQLQKGFNGAAL